MLLYEAHPILERLTTKAIEHVKENTSSQHELILIRHSPESRMGIAEAYNKGFRSATGDVFCCLHNDVFVPPRWDVPLAEVALRGDVAFPMVDEPPLCEQRGVRRTAKWQTTGCCFMLSRTLWEKLDGYDESFRGFHWEDTDLFMRAAKQHRASLVRCNVAVTHHRGATRSFVLNEEDGYFAENFERYKKRWGDNLSIPILSETPQEG